MARQSANTLPARSHLLPSLLFTATLSPISAAEVCDIDSNGTINREDINLILQATTRPAETPFDPMDVDRDGRITSSDARRCVCKLTIPDTCIIQPNQAPVANPGSNQTVPATSSATLSLNGGNSIDPDGDRLRYNWVFQQRPADSQTVLSKADSATPSFVPDRPGIYIIRLTVTDDFDSSHSNTVTVTVQQAEPLNQKPIAANDGVTVNKDSGNTLINVLNNDSDPDGDTLSIVALTGAAHGFVVNNGSTVSYTPAGAFVGTDSFTYTIDDAHGHTATATVTVTVVTGTPLNRVPIAANDSITVNKNSRDTLINVLNNDSDPDGDTLSIVALTGAAHGFVVNNGSTVSYTPAGEFVGTDSFTYTIDDAHGHTATATVTVTVVTGTPLNRRPIAANDSITVNKNSRDTLINVLNNDSDPDGDTLSIVALTGAAHGFLVNNGSTVSYTPTREFVGTDSFTYTIDDGHGHTTTATVTITVVSINPPLIAVADTNTSQQGGASVTGNVTSNDTLGNAIILVTSIAHNGQTFAPNTPFQTGAGATLQLQEDGHYTYTPSSDVISETIEEQFIYTIIATDGQTSQTSLTITLTPANQSPLAQPDVAETQSGGGTISGNVIDNDNLGDAPTTVTPISISPTAQSGSLTLTAGGEFTYTPPTELVDTVKDVFTYVIQDQDGETSSTTLTITITPANQSPEAKADTRITREGDAAIIGNVTQNDNLGNTPTEVTAFTHNNQSFPFGITFDTIHGGWFRLFEDGRYMYVMPTEEQLEGIVREEFPYTITDADGEISSSTLSIDVFPGNKTPLARPDTAQVIINDNDDTPPLSGNVLINDLLGDLPVIVTPQFIQTTPFNGSFTLDNEGHYIYTPPLELQGIAREIFGYTLTDHDHEISRSTLTIIVSGISSEM